MEHQPTFIVAWWFFYLTHDFLAVICCKSLQVLYYWKALHNFIMYLFVFFIFYNAWLFTGSSACLCCTLFQAINWLDCSFWPWRWQCRISNVFFQTASEKNRLLVTLKDVTHVRLILFLWFYSDTRSTCCGLEDFEGKTQLFR